MNRSFLNGFVKRASEYGFNQNEAAELYKQALMPGGPAQQYGNFSQMKLPQVDTTQGSPAGQYNQGMQGSILNSTEPPPPPTQSTIYQTPGKFPTTQSGIAGVMQSHGMNLPKPQRPLTPQEMMGGGMTPGFMHRPPQQNPVQAAAQTAFRDMYQM